MLSVNVNGKGARIAPSAKKANVGQAFHFCGFGAKFEDYVISNCWLHWFHLLYTRVD